MEGLYSERSGFIAGLHGMFGEIASPNLILPDWAIDGVAHLLFEEYVQRRVKAPYTQSIFTAGAIPDLDKASNHPEIWPGRLGYRIYGRPFYPLAASTVWLEYNIRVFSTARCRYHPH